MTKNCDNCCWRLKYDSKFCMMEEVSPKENICDLYHSECDKCGNRAEYSFNEKHYCGDCLLSEFEVEQSSVTHYYHGGEYIGSDEDMDEVINNLDEDIEEI